MKTRMVRMPVELYDFFSYRSKLFGTTKTKEGQNLLAISEELSRTLGIDLKEIPVQNNKPIIKPKKQVLVLR